MLIAKCDPADIESTRRNWPFLRDRRVDAYGPILAAVHRRMNTPASQLRMPAEWEPHRATWIAWPHHEPDWPTKFEPIPWVYAEIARVLAEHEPVEILCQSADGVESARTVLDAHAVRMDRIRLHVVPTDRVWLRDSAPNWRHRPGWQRCSSELGIQWLGEIRQLDISTRRSDQQSPKSQGFRRVEPCRPVTRERLVLEGGGIETNGQGSCSSLRSGY